MHLIYGKPSKTVPAEEALRDVAPFIRRVDQPRRKKQRRPWGDRLTYRIGEVMDQGLRLVLYEE